MGKKTQSYVSQKKRSKWPVGTCKLVNTTGHRGDENLLQRDALSHLLERLKSKSLSALNVGEGMEELEPLYICGGM